MTEQKYGCNHCKVVFTASKKNEGEDKSEVKCPYCGGMYVQKLDSPGDVDSFVRSMVYTGG